MKNSKKHGNCGCKSLHCAMTDYDIEYNDVNWVFCESCQEWFHTLCEGFTCEEEILLSERHAYKCRACSNDNVYTETQSSKLDALLKEQTQLTEEETSLKVECDNLTRPAMET